MNQSEVGWVTTSTSEKYDRSNVNGKTQLIMIRRQNHSKNISSSLDKPIGVHSHVIHPFPVMSICDMGGQSLHHPLEVLASKKAWILRIALFFAL